MFNDYLSTMKNRLGLGRPLEGYSMNPEGRDPRPMPGPAVDGFDPEGRVPRPFPTPATDGFDPEGRVPKPFPGPAMGGFNPEGWSPRPGPNHLGSMGHMGSPWQAPVGLGGEVQQAPPSGGFNPMPQRTPWQRF